MAISGPAMAGPTKRATLKQSELQATAAGRSVRGTSPGIRLCRAGWAKEEAMPLHISSASSSPMLSFPVAISRPTVDASSAITDCEAMVSLTRSIRSATAPAIGLKITAGARSQKATMPTQKALLVISQASQVTAMRCTQRPVQEISEAVKNSLASRCDSARPSAPRGRGQARRNVTSPWDRVQRCGGVRVFCCTQSSAMRSRSIDPAQPVGLRAAGIDAGIGADPRRPGSSSRINWPRSRVTMMRSASARQAAASAAWSRTAWLGGGAV